jgi:hypothetical protein
MFKHLIYTVFVALVAIAAPAAAGQQEFRVTAVRANIRQQPSAASQVIGQAVKGSEFAVLADLGSWIGIELESAPTPRIGYIHRTLGVVEAAHQATVPVTTVETSHDAAPAASHTAEGPAASPVSSPEPVAPSRDTVVATVRPASQVSTITAPAPTRRLGIGGRAGGFSFGLGASARLWHSDHFGVELQFSHYGIGETQSYGGITASAHVGVTQFAPLALYRFAPADDDDDTTVVPYVGGGMNFYRSTTTTSASGFGSTDHESTSQLSKGIVVLGGAEVRFKSAPRLTVSGDLGYYQTATPFGVSIGGLSWSLSGHWYVR